MQTRYYEGIVKPKYYNQFARPPKRHRSIKGIIAAVSCVVIATAYSATTLAWPLQTLSAEPVIAASLPATPVAIDWPTYGQSAAYAPGYGLLGADGPDNAMPIASITKIVTALTVLDKKPISESSPGETITFTAADVALYNDYVSRQGSVAPVTPGQTISQRDMLTVMLVASANNYADRLAIWAFGSLAAYLEAANQYLAARGLEDSRVADASGFSPESLGTAKDLVRLGELALAEPLIAQAVNTEQLVIAGLGSFRNTNLLIHQDKAASGIKTGTTDEAGSCLLYAKDFVVGEQTVTIIGATLGAPNHAVLAADAGKVLATTHTGFADVTFANKGHFFATYQTQWDETVHAVTPAKVHGVTWQGSEVQSKIITKDIGYKSTPTNIGTVTFTQGQKTIATAQLELESTVPEPSWWWRLSHPWLVFKS